MLISVGSVDTDEEEDDEEVEKKPRPGERTNEWKKKDVRDYTDADVERLFDQWEEGEDETDPDDLPEHLRPQAQFDINELTGKEPEDIVKVTKKGRTLMMFVTVSGNPSRKEADEITLMWQSQLFNAHYEMTRYMIEDNRAILVLKDGSTAVDIKNFLIDQERCEEVTFENQSFPGKHLDAKDKKESKKDNKTEQKKKSKKKKKKKDDKKEENSKEEKMSKSKKEEL
uniref:LDLR chaperone MESD-like n=1 Tax=Saccoglossus kowalevskii TaxID=10224 RepID=A0ABM0MPE7_SACKO|nr:PREDICTED: LDLR chaperone MESD-like [Saccoglossus kowalevskii]